MRSLRVRPCPVERCGPLALRNSSCPGHLSASICNPAVCRRSGDGMARRASYTKVKRKDFENPPHVEGMSDRGFKGFQCLNKQCTNFLICSDADLGVDFEVRCPVCGFNHQTGETITLYEYDLINEADNTIVQSGPFEILHDDYVAEATRFKYCIVCGTIKPFELFDKHSSPENWASRRVQPL